MAFAGKRVSEKEDAPGESCLAAPVAKESCLAASVASVTLASRTVLEAASAERREFVSAPVDQLFDFMPMPSTMMQFVDKSELPWNWNFEDWGDGIPADQLVYNEPPRTTLDLYIKVMLATNGKMTRRTRDSLWAVRTTEPGRGLTRDQYELSCKLNKYLRRYGQVKVELRDLLMLEAWHDKDPRTQNAWGSVLMEMCNDNIHNFITLILVNEDKRFVLRYAPRSTSAIARDLGRPRSLPVGAAHQDPKEFLPVLPSAGDG